MLVVELRNYSPAEVSQSPHDVSTLSPFMMNRVLYLLKHDEHITPGAVEINYVQSGSPENHMRAPISVLQSADTTIHKFAARALLGDLERGESGMHAEFSEATPDVADQVRLKGEALGCMWSLVSKWTSFVAVEVPVFAHESDGDLATPEDGEGGRAGRQGRGLNLLRRQGDPSDAVRGLGTIEPMEIDSESSDSEDDESTSHASQGDEERRDDDADIGGDGGPGQGGAGSGTSEPGDEPGRRGTGGGWNHGGDASDQQHEESADHPQGPDAGTPTRGVVREVSIRTAAPEPRPHQSNIIARLGAAQIFPDPLSYRYGAQPDFDSVEAALDSESIGHTKTNTKRGGVKTKDSYYSLNK